MVLGTAKLRHRKSTVWPTTRGRDVSKEIRHKTCSTERISVLSNKIERNHPLWHTPGVVSFSMYSCSHFKKLSLGAMSKRGQNTTSNYGSPTARARPVNLVMHSPCNEEISSPSLGSLVKPGNDDERKGSDKHQETGCSATQIGSRKLPSKTTREGSSSHQETGAEGSSPNKEWREPLRHKETCCILTRVQKHGTHEPSIHE